MKSSGPKIIIKPRLTGSRGTAAKATPTRPAPMTPSGDADLDRAESEDEEGELSEGQPYDVADQTTQGDDGERSLADMDDVDEGEEGGVAQDGEGEGTSGLAMARGKGRSRGRGRGLSVATPPRGRGRPRGSGKPRGRGRGARGGPLTIRLPGRPDEEGQGDRENLEGGKEGAAEEVEEKEAPLGGGKPFRKIQGKVYIIENDEFVTEDDPKGDTKIDVYGNLLGGRRFKAATFTLPNRHPQRQYMLAIDAARTSGFRDSLYYFRRNLLALKLNATQPEKEYLIEAGKLGSHLRTRSVTLITARSAYKLHGAKMILDGKWVEDDYFEEKSLEEITAKGLKAGDPVGELPDPQMYSSEAAALAAAAKAGANTQSKTDRGGAIGVYRAGGPTTIFGGPGWGPYSDGPLNAVRKSMLNRDGLNEENWMHIAAQRTVEAGEEWMKIRREALKVCGGVLTEGWSKGKDSDEVFPVEDFGASSREGADGVTGKGKRRKLGKERDDLPLGVYEPHGGIVHYRTDTQPTRSRWEVLPNSSKRRVLGGTKTGNGAWALAWVDTVMELPSAGALDGEGQQRKTQLNSVEMVSQA